MRRFLACLVPILLPNLASAECQCTCVRGKATAICRPQALVEPICQQVCVEKIEQSLGTIGGGGALGGIGLGNSLGVGNSIGIGSTVGVDAGAGVGIDVSGTSPVGGVDPATGVANIYERSPANSGR